MTDAPPPEVDLRERSGTLARRISPAPAARTGTARPPEPEHATWIEHAQRAVAPRWVWVIVPLLVVAPVLGAYLFAMSQPTMYGARAEVLYDGPDTDRRSTSTIMNTQGARVTSRQILGPVAGAYGLNPIELEKDIDVEQVQESSVLRITVGNEDKALASKVVEHLAGRYSVLVNDRSQLGQERRYLQDQIAPLEAQYQLAQTQLARAGRSDVQQATLQSELSSLRSQIQGLRDQLTQTELEQLTNQESARIVTHATALEKPLRPQPLRAMAAGLLAGLFLAAALVASLRYFGVIAAPAPAVQEGGRESTRWPPR